VAVLTLVLWTITAAAGVSLLRTGGTAKRQAAEARRASAEAAASAEATAPVEAGTARAAGRTATAEAQTARAATTLPRSLALPRTDEGKPPPVPRVKVATPPGEHPLLEFSHPALAVTGFACWFMFTFVHYVQFAWISFGILLVTIALGLTWLARNVQAARHHASGAWKFPPRLVAAHGAGAAVGIALTVLTALVASHG
jgi:hypothetical protein